MDPVVQGKILRAIETKRFERLGGTRTLFVERGSWFHAARPRPVGRGRQPAGGPVLSDERGPAAPAAAAGASEDIELLPSTSSRSRGAPPAPAPAALPEVHARFRGYPFPGNLRELAHAVESRRSCRRKKRSASETSGDFSVASPAMIRSAADAGRPLHEVEWAYIEESCGASMGTSRRRRGSSGSIGKPSTRRSGRAPSLPAPDEDRRGLGGKPKDAPLAGLHDRYADRIRRLGAGYDCSAVPDVRPAVGTRTITSVSASRGRCSRRRRSTAGAWRSIGPERSSRARRSPSGLERWSHPSVAFLIGGPLGHDPALLARSEVTWSLSPLTLPHELVRVILAEQLLPRADHAARRPLSQVTERFRALIRATRGPNLAAPAPGGGPSPGPRVPTDEGPNLPLCSPHHAVLLAMARSS